MNRKSHITKQVRDDKLSSFVVEQKEKTYTPAEVTMSDIAKKLRSVHTQMQMKHSPHNVISRSFMEESFKSYLDDISRAILAEHYIRRQKEKKLFESLEKIIMLVQSLQNQKKSIEKTMGTRLIDRSKSLVSVVQKLADIEGEGKQECSLLQEISNCSKQNSITASQTNFENALQHENKSSLQNDALKPFSKKTEELATHSTIKKRYSDVKESGHCIEYDRSLSLNMKPQRTFFFLYSSLKKIFRCFLIIAFMATIALCFYSFLRGARFFDF
ncbi:hypothetical protein BHOIPH791_06970 [Bartonella henselae]|uniref:hypothetical protein n=1 Tax=Bartonella henselae TaxID=38323 RepID=UPI0003DFABE8|nr:hypothetical protein [Bartonella henselae]ETS11428.1 hypothetical protein Q653_00351 [Bartonella henselae JK 42]ETS15434.1 hypothetical protein Q652_00484 [Bartonella henselae JK 41]KEC57317.1 hypothetical protein O97_01135 [Bartonella henselae str. Zeus]KEC59519.1 hypothetical protein O95_01224 [Bartonella henselae JK 53]MDM9983207.1 hypothetical protein [Bartonella henselae]